MRRDRTHRILAKDVVVSNDTWATGINNNTLIIGSSGAGKTRGFVIPNILASEGSIVVSDTKGELYGQLGDTLRQKGFEVGCVDFINPLNSTYGYDPLQQVRVRNGRFSEQDMMSVAAALCPIESKQDPFWDYAAQGMLASYIGYVLEALPLEEANLGTVCKLYDATTDGRYDMLIQDLKEEMPDSFAARQYSTLKASEDSPRTYASIACLVGGKLAPFRFDEALALFAMPNRVRFGDIRKRKTALFINVSDCDRSLDRLIALFYGQMFKALIESDPDGIPVHVILDDFACGCRVKDFDNYTSVIRSRGVYASIIIQSISQLNGLYGSQASTIVENCDTILYLGGNDPGTAQVIGQRINRPPHDVLSMPTDRSYIIRRGESPRTVRRRLEPSLDDGIDAAAGM